MSSVRVTYSGLISFAVGTVTIITGLIFTLIVTRQLTQEEFGTWGLVGALTGYVLVMSPVISYWTTREIARGEESGKTSMLSTTGLTGIGIIVYIGIAILMAFQEGIDFYILILAAILVPIEYFRMTLNSISLGYKPQISEYGLLVFELTKIPLGFLMVVHFEMGIVGAIITVAIATITNIITLAITTRKKLKGQFSLEHLKKWLRLFWLPTFPKIGQLFLQSEVVVYTIISGSVGGLAYWIAANTISRTVKHALRVNKALYPKLVSGGKKEYFQDNIVTVFYFALPLMGLTIVFAKPGLFLLNPIYEMAWPIVIISSFTVLLRNLSEIFKQSLTGIEQVDASKTSVFKDYLRSKLFVVPLITNIQRAVYIGTLVLVLAVSSTQSEIDLVIYWAWVALFTELPFMVYLYILVQKEFEPKIDFTKIGKYLGSTIVSFVIVHYIMEEFLVYDISIYQFLPEFLKYVFLSALLYIFMTYAIDKKTRNLVNSVLKEFRKKVD